jgi:hypothetical protein
MNAKPWTLYMNTLDSLLRGLTTNSYGFEFPAGVSAPGLVVRNYPNDATAAFNGVPLGGLYHNAGAVRIRIT